MPVTINATPEHALFLRVGVVIAQHVPALTEMFTRPFSIRDPARLRTLYAGAGFHDISIDSEIRPIGFASFDDYFSGIEKGATLSGQEYVRLPEATKRVVRDGVRQDLPQSQGSGPFTIDMELLVGSGRR